MIGWRSRRFIGSAYRVMQVQSYTPVEGPISTVRDVWREHYATPRGYRLWPCEELVRAVGDRKFGTILEAGCGNGANLWFLAEHATTVFGVDSCPEALAAAHDYMATRHIVRQVELVGCDVLEMRVSDNSVDAVIDVMTSQHLPWAQHAALYREYRRVLRRGGWLFLYGLTHGTTTTGARRLQAFTYDQLPALFPGAGPVCLPQAPMLRAAVDAAGFKTGQVRRSSRTYTDGAEAVYLALEATAA